MYRISSIQMDEAIRELDEAEKKQIPFAMARALTRTAQIVKVDERKEMERVFDAPTAFTLNSLFIKPATKKNLQATVWLKDWTPKGTAAADYLEPQIMGGGRRQKRGERALKARGFIGKNEYLMPGKGTRLNRFGNISKAQMVKALSNIGGQRDSLQNSTDNGKKVFFFNAKAKGRLKRGIYKRTGKKTVRSFLLATSAPTYQKTFDFSGVADKAVELNVTKEFLKSLTEALA